MIFFLRGFFQTTAIILSFLPIILFLYFLVHRVSDVQLITGIAAVCVMVPSVMLLVFWKYGRLSFNTVRSDRFSPLGIMDLKTYSKALTCIGVIFGVSSVIFVSSWKYFVMNFGIVLPMMMMVTLSLLALEQSAVHIISTKKDTE